MFGRFRLFPAQRLLLDGKVPVRMNPNTLALLTVLVEHAGEVLSEEALVDRVWPGQTAAQVRLADHVEVLNRLFRRSRPLFDAVGRPSDGYRLVLPADGSPQAAPLVGRDEVVGIVAERLLTARFATLVGPGGIGKTSVALAAARSLAGRLAEGVVVVDLAPLTSDTLVPGALAAALGVPTPPGDAVSGLVSLLEGRELLVLLDNCEHVIDAAAVLAEALLLGLPRVRVLATSREPLRAQGEWQLRIGPLDVPGAADAHDARSALAWSAVRLFVERACVDGEPFVLSDPEAATVAEICCRLDGIPLAIELAAARVVDLGVAELLRQIQARLLTVAPAAPAQVRRHQTLHAALDWSFTLLSADEQVVLTHLATFRGEFTLDDGMAVARAGADTAEGIAGLAAKSLVAIEPRGLAVHYRLFETTRAYALQKLVSSGGARDVFLRHAGQCHRRLDQGVHDWATLPRKQWRLAHAPSIDDLRAALDWAFSADGDVRLGMALTADAMPLGDQLGLLAEFRGRAEVALAAIGSLDPPDPVLELRLQSMLGDFTQQTNGAHDVVDAALSRALVLAGQIGEPEHLRGPLMGKWMGAFGRGEYPRARDFAERLMASSAASGDGLGTFVADRMLAQAKHFLGHHEAASHHAEQVLLQSGRRFPLRMTPTPIDVRCSMRIVLARIGWLQGDGAQAQGLADEALAVAHEDHAYAVCQALCLAVVPIALWQGDDDGARRHVADLVAHARRQQLPVWERWGLGLEAVLAERAGGPPAAPPPGHKSADAFATFTGRLPDAGVLQRAVAGDVGWCAPEVFRAEGEAVLRLGGEDAPAQAEGWFRRAHGLAIRQSAHAWTLRAATSLGRLLRDTGRATEADGLLAAALRHCGGGVDADRARTLRAGL